MIVKISRLVWGILQSRIHATMGGHFIVIRLPMNHFLEIRSCNLKPAMREEFYRLVVEQSGKYVMISGIRKFRISGENYDYTTNP